VPSLTIKKIEDTLLERLREQAQRRNTSLNSFVRELLARAVGYEQGMQAHTDLSQLAGCWSEEDENEFRDRTRPFDEIDPALWR
jgi:plasmid stability protein